MLNKQYPLYLANKPQQPNTDLDVTDKYTGEVATRVALADEALLDKAIAAADAPAEVPDEVICWPDRDADRRCDFMVDAIIACSSFAMLSSDFMALSAASLLMSARYCALLSAGVDIALSDLRAADFKSNWLAPIAAGSVRALSVALAMGEFLANGPYWSVIAA